MVAEVIEKLHYYCSNTTFLSILQHKELWLTALSLSNDRLEGRWALEQYLNLFQGDRARLRKSAHVVIEAFLHGREALGICFSEKEDLLSQWRGYADDGCGVCITFSKEALDQAVKDWAEEEEIRIAKVKYGRLAEHDFVKPIAEAFMNNIENVNADGRFLSEHINHTDQKWRVASEFFEYKHPAFSEEAEWRIYSVVGLGSGSNLDYRVAGKLLSPYLRFPISLDAISFVTLGPNNRTPTDVAKAALARHKCNAGVVRSAASYRER